MLRVIERLCVVISVTVCHLKRRNGMDDNMKAAWCVGLTLYEMMELVLFVSCRCWNGIVHYLGCSVDTSVQKQWDWRILLIDKELLVIYEFGVLNVIEAILRRWRCYTSITMVLNSSITRESVDFARTTGFSQGCCYSLGVSILLDVVNRLPEAIRTQRRVFHWSSAAAHQYLVMT